ncbi:FHA domain protein [Ophiocordyceps camponoti-floridani]|uniref:FHA domain protein n=1 Tax=Ophiocordyceps camponoti-floridani TaxID=2030778 RepID=A0A8H4QCS4_9HYPO|nr:FHA domain protein [Ophiocordyceps camponoti-floridani]
MSSNHADQVRVDLIPTSRPSEASNIVRHLVLTRDAPTLQIGRMSQRNSELRASSANAWFESAVMSRHHAMLYFDADQTTLSIEDTKSLHGTFQNGTRLEPGTQSQLQSGDELCFGITVDRHTDTFPPCAMTVAFEFNQANSQPRQNPVIYKVPDDTDIEDTSDDDDDDDEDEEAEDSSICSSIHVLRENCLHPAEAFLIRDTVAVDLTSDVNTPENQASDCEVQVPDYHQDENAPIADEKLDDEDHDVIPETVQHDGVDPSEDVWQPVSPVSHSVDNHQGADTHAQPCPREWQDRSSTEQFRVASVRPSTLPASWETQASSDGPESDAGVAFCLNPVLSSLPPSSPTPGRNKVDLKKTTSTQESSSFCDPARTIVSPQDMARPPASGSDSLLGFKKQSAQAAAKALGQKAGKPEYFAARLENKRFVEHLCEVVQQLDQTVADPPKRAAEEAHHEDIAMENTSDEDRGGPEKDDQVSLFALSGENPLIALEDASKNSLLASGEKFLLSPPKEPVASRPPVESPELSDLSAHEFELSKLNAEAKREARQLAGNKRTCLKRKAADMLESDLTVGRQASSGSPETRLTARNCMDESRAVKRLRTAAEVLGYAALGGVAVVSALIATAPSL